MSQKDLAKKINVTPQQIQKYESGENNITVSKLQDISNALNIDIRDFFIDKPSIDDNSGYLMTVKNIFNKIKSNKSKEKIIKIIDLMSLEDN